MGYFVGKFQHFFPFQIVFINIGDFAIQIVLIKNI